MSVATARETQATYDAIADTYAQRKLSRGVGAYVHEMLALTTTLVPDRAMTVDVGCGHGHELALLLGYGLRCVGMDRSAGMLRHAAGRPGASPVVQGDAAGLPFADTSLDLVVSVHGLVHLSAAEMPVAFEEIRRVLRPRGVLATSLLRGEGSSREEVTYAPGFFRTFTFLDEPAVRGLVETAGLRVLHAREIDDAGGTTWVVAQRIG